MPVGEAVMGPRSHDRNVGVVASVALGSNLGERLGHLQAAANALACLPDSKWVASSRVYETAPVGGPSQGPYLNAVVRLRTRLSAREVLDALLAIERDRGRVRGPERWSPRSLDLDLLLYGEEILDEPGLCVPHPKLGERRFVLLPLCELANAERDPRSGETFEILAHRLRAASCDGPVGPPLEPKHTN